MPKDNSLKKVMVIGSGPIVIGQAAEFDYAGTQACMALKEEGIQVVLMNSNPATIMTDTNIADRVYMEPLTVEFAEKIIKRERPDGLLPTLGGQVGLNIAVELYKRGVLERYGVKLLGTPIYAIQKAEDRKKFKSLMEELGEPVPESTITGSVEEALVFAEDIGYPLIVRPAYTLGGTGGGIARNPRQLVDIVAKGIKNSPIKQVLLERCIAGWKEIEYEVMRDSYDNCITVCNMENIDPVGIHTGDSIVVAPSQTLSDKEYQLLRSASLKIIRALEIEGGCNIQFALDPKSMNYYVIEVNPRVSRSSALASKATGYPIARIATKIAIGMTLDEIPNPITGKTCAAFEPALDYVVVKIPRWPFDKFAMADRTLGTQMKATGEVMAIDRTFQGALMKAIRSLELGIYSLTLDELVRLSTEELLAKIKQSSDERILAIAEILSRGVAPEEINRITGIDMFFLNKIKEIITMEKALQNMAWDELTKDTLYKAKRLGISDNFLARAFNKEEKEIRELRQSLGVIPVYKTVDTCAAEFEAETPYFYSTYEQEDEAVPSDRKKVVIIGSGPIRIGQGIEFDYCSVHSVWALKDEGIEAIIINNNPETVSTDFSTSDRLYFEPLTEEDVINVIHKEKPYGVVVQFGGQTAINLVEALKKEGIKILGTPVEAIDTAEDREKFDEMLNRLHIPRPPGGTAYNRAQALQVAEEIGFPLLVRPSYVLGGRAMEIVYSSEELENYIDQAVKVSPRHPILLDRYLMGKEIEVDAVSDGRDVLIPGIMEHIERAGVHSGDSTAVYPTQSVEKTLINQIVEYTEKITRALNIVGMINIQYVIYKGQLYVLEVNPRSSRTVPFLSKVTGIPMVELATKVMLDKTLKDLGYSGGLYPEPDFVAVKAPVFSFAKLLEVEPSLGPEMKSTGEVIGMDRDFEKALYKAFTAAGIEIPEDGGLLATIADRDKAEAIPIIKGFKELGFVIYATEGTARALEREGVKAIKINKIRQPSPNILDLIRENKINFVLNTLTRGKQPERDGFRIRRAAAENCIPCITSLDTGKAILQVLRKTTFMLKPLTRERITCIQ